MGKDGRRRIYVASSWKNKLQPTVVEMLRRLGHDVYDFKNPPGGTDFAWSSIDPAWQSWSTEQYRDALRHPLAIAGYAADVAALARCDDCVLVLPSGRSSSLELGYALGQGKCGYVLQVEREQPELMYFECTVLASFAELLEAFKVHARDPREVAGRRV